MSKGLENALLDRVVASAIVSVCTRYVVEVERELLSLRLQVFERGTELGNIELLGTVEERLSNVHDRMNGLSGDVLKLMTEVRKELSRIGSTGTADPDSQGKKRGRPPKAKASVSA